MEHEFKVGDWVTTIDGFSKSRGDNYGGAGYLPNNTFLINIAANGIAWEKNKNGVYFKALRPALPHEIPGNQQEINLQIGDTFRNSVGNLKKVIWTNNTWFTMEDVITGRKSDLLIEDFRQNIEKNKYTDYTPVSQQKTVKQWKKEDFYNTKIVVDTPEKSRRFQELLFSLGLKWCGPNPYKIHNESFIYGLIVKSGNRNISYYRVEDKALFITNAYKEIFYNEIFNENNNQLNNNQNGKTENNDLFRKNFSGNGSKEAATAISFRRTSKIATSSGYTGNQIKGRRVDTKIGRSEISFSAISI